MSQQNYRPVAHFCTFLRLKLTGDHNDTDSSISAQFNGACDFFTWRIQHAHAANEGQVSLRCIINRVIYYKIPVIARGAKQIDQIFTS